MTILLRLKSQDLRHPKKNGQHLIKNFPSKSSFIKHYLDEKEKRKIIYKFFL
jgi:hypothetical protein